MPHPLKDMKRRSGWSLICVYNDEQPSVFTVIERQLALDTFVADHLDDLDGLEEGERKAWIRDVEKMAAHLNEHGWVEHYDLTYYLTESVIVGDLMAAPSYERAVQVVADLIGPECLIEYQGNPEYVRGVCEVLADLYPGDEPVEHQVRKQQIADDLGVKFQI